VGYDGPTDARLTVIRLLDYHSIPPELGAAAGMDFREHLPTVERVQTDQLSISRFLVEWLGVKAVSKEALTTASLPDRVLRLSLLRDLAEWQRLGGFDDGARERRRLLLFEVGVAGQLQLAGLVGRVLPLDDDAALEASNPVADGKVMLDPERMAARERAMAGNLPAQGSPWSSSVRATTFGRLYRRGPCTCV
jgi:hypothetical protein